MPQNVPSFDELFQAAQYSAVHLEMRDQYAVGDEADDFNTWLATGRRDVDPASEYWAPWTDMISSAVERGVVVRRARIVSEPVTDYIRYEHAGAVVNVAAGEQVRWLPRRQAVDLMLPGGRPVDLRRNAGAVQPLQRRRQLGRPGHGTADRASHRQAVLGRVRSGVGPRDPSRPVRDPLTGSTTASSCPYHRHPQPKPPARTWRGNCATCRGTPA